MIDLIPKPLILKEGYGAFFINSTVKAFCDKKILPTISKLFYDEVAKILGFQIATAKESEAQLKFLIAEDLKEEEYKIEITSESATVWVSGQGGAVNAVSTLKQLFSMGLIKSASYLSAPAVFIHDKPFYEMRGLLLDVSRHFFTKDEVKRLLNRMADYKLNTFHWHLTDNQGWRVEIKKYPELTKAGAERSGSQWLAWGKPNAKDDIPRAGFYTQKDITEIVAYAKDLNIMVIPEIDMPGHFASALTAYPELSCDGKGFSEIPLSYLEGNLNGVACLGSEKIYEFTYAVIDELVKLFPAPYFHIGGDEVFKRNWKNCPHCQETIKAHGLDGELGLHGFFNNRVATHLKKNGKRMICWNEVLKCGGILKDIVAQYWTPLRDKHAETALNAGRKIIVSKHSSFYFDMPHAYVGLNRTYNFKVEDINLTNDEGGILGITGALWTEWVKDEDRLNFQLFPRLFALAETGWTCPKQKDYKSFLKRLPYHLSVLKGDLVTFAPKEIWDKRDLKGMAKFLKADAHYEYNKIKRETRNEKHEGN
ncbi:MAG: beta-N-acetylhexosaminidase [Firmicutes bacterium]|nr:beta-N-acetylhexosaminidase [Bacillota bacterium]